ncbi:hypothetical protein KP509_1Z046300 [Ceratopteris richardii]|nr:hypothetical protein KP509_1Z046300 [Ceratopteris richardii]
MPSVEESGTSPVEEPITTSQLSSENNVDTVHAVEENAEQHVSDCPTTIDDVPATVSVANGGNAPEVVHEESAPPAEDGAVEEGSDDDAEDGEEAEEEQPPVIGTIEEAEELFQQGRKALSSNEYDQATELLSRALEIRAHHYGELAFECAFNYYKYGCALLYKAQSESDPLGNDEKAEDEEDIEDDEESDLDMAWKMLDIARVIYEKQQSHSIELVDVITALADVSLEREDFEMCLRDYTRALEILEGLVEPDDRGIAELCFKLSLALQLGYKPKEALKYCQRAVSVCEARIKRLHDEVAASKRQVQLKEKAPVCEKLPEATPPEESPAMNADVCQENSCQKQENEIKEIEELLGDLREKVGELQMMASGPSLLESLKETNPAAVESISQVFKVTAQMRGQGGDVASSSEQDSSHGFDAPTNLASTAPVTHLGVVGRGVKRATPVPISNGSETSTVKKRSLDDMMTGGGAGDTQIGFGSSG